MNRVIRIAIALVIPFVMLSALGFVLVHASNSISADMGPMWGNPINISQNDGTSNYSQVLLDERGYIHVVWRDNSVYPYDYQILHRMRSPDGTWSETEVVPNSQYLSGRGEAALDWSGTVHLVWEVDTPRSIQYAYRPVLGAWSTPITLSTNTVSYAAPKLAIDLDGNLCVIWLASTGLMHTERPAEGSWSSPTLAIPGAGEGFDVAVDDDRVVHVAFCDSGEIYHSSHSFGGPWTTKINVSNNETSSELPFIAVDTVDGIHFAWKDLGGPDNWEIFYRSYISDTWGNVTNVSNISGKSYRIRLAVAPDGAVHIAWAEYGTGVGGCYYTSKPPGEEWSSPDNRPYGGCEIAVAENGDAHWLWRESNSLYHAWRTPQSDWSSPELVQTLADLSYINLAPGSAHSVFATWSGKPAYPGNNDVMFAVFYEVSITSTLPITFTNSDSSVLEISGSNFMSTPNVYLGEIGLSHVVFSSTTVLTVEVPAGFQPGWYNVIVGNPDGVYGRSDFVVEVRNPTPVISNVSPPETFNVVPSVLTIYGKDFIPTPTLRLESAWESCNLSDLRFIDNGHLLVTLPVTVPAGWYSLTVANPGPGMPSSTLSNALYVKPPWRVLLPLILKIQ